MQRGIQKILTLIILLSFFYSGPTAFAWTERLSNQLSYHDSIAHEKIINQELHLFQKTFPSVNRWSFSPSQYLHALQQWFTTQPQISFASLIDSTLTIKFIDGSFIILLDVFPSAFEQNNEDLQNFQSSMTPTQSAGKTALLLNPSEYLYGHRQCQRILSILLKKEYNIEYRANQDVDLSFLRHNLTADVIYMDTHAGYWDVDGDQHPDNVVIATGEYWTNDTPLKYPFEYQNHLIVEGVVGTRHLIAFTPEFIEYFYSHGSLPHSLIYMATCYASYDNTMANAFLSVGADAYVGWTQNTVFWTNSMTSVHAFRLLAAGLSVKQTCILIRYGGFYNWLFRSKLIYFGDGTHQIPR